VGELPGALDVSLPSRPISLTLGRPSSSVPSVSGLLAHAASNCAPPSASAPEHLGLCRISATERTTRAETCTVSASYWRESQIWGATWRFARYVEDCGAATMRPPAGSDSDSPPSRHLSGEMGQRQAQSRKRDGGQERAHHLASRTSGVNCSCSSPTMSSGSVPAPRWRPETSYAT